MQVPHDWGAFMGGRDSMNVFMIRIAVAALIILFCPAAFAGAPGAVGDLYVSNWSGSNVVQYDGVTGAYVGVFCSGGISSSQDMIFGPSGNIFVSSYYNSCVIQFDGDTGASQGIFVSGVLRYTHNLRFGANGNLFVSGHDNSVVECDGDTGAPIRTIAVDGNPQGLDFGPNGNLFVAHWSSHAVVEYDAVTGARLGVFASGGGLLSPSGLIFGPNDNLFVSSYSTDEVIEYDGTTGAFIRVFASGGGLDQPEGLVFGPNGNLFVTSNGTSDVMEYSGATGAFIRVFTSGGGLAGPTGLGFKPEPPADSDGDGVPDTDDNCPDVSNSSQTDANVNGVGDVCETNVNAYIRATSGDPVAGRPSWNPILKIYEDVFQLENESASQAILLPMAAVLETLTPPSVSGENTDNEAHSSGLPPDACWRYTVSYSDGTVGDLSDGTLDPGESISRIWRIDDPTDVVFTFWANAVAAGLPARRGGDGGERDMGDETTSGFGREGTPFGGGRPELGALGAPSDSGSFHDDGTAEIYLVSPSGRMVVANRFTAPVTSRLSSISFYTSGTAAGDPAEVIIYEDPTGSAPVPEPAMEVWRAPVVLGDGGFQEVPMSGLPLNRASDPGAAFFVAVANTADRGYSLGVDMTGSKAGASYLSTDGGATFAPLSSSPIIDGNAMIRASVEPTTCFIGAVQ